MAILERDMIQQIRGVVMAYSARERQRLTTESSKASDLIYVKKTIGSLVALHHRLLSEAIAGPMPPHWSQGQAMQDAQTIMYAMIEMERAISAQIYPFGALERAYCLGFMRATHPDGWHEDDDWTAIDAPPMMTDDLADLLARETVRAPRDPEVLP